MTELDVARAIAAGEMPSPTVFYNATFYAVRISGTGCAWRESVGEFCWREPRVWLSPEMTERWRGAPIVWQHPENGALDTETFAQTVIGSIIFAWVRDNELWGVGRVMDADAAALLDSGAFDTSPSVLFAPGTNSMIEFRGEQLLVERNPELVDHLAICAAGVWAKGEPGDKGVEITGTSTNTINEGVTT